jgi:hypothetical protein
MAHISRCGEILGKKIKTIVPVRFPRCSPEPNPGRGVSELRKANFAGFNCARKLCVDEEVGIELFQDKEVQLKYSQLLMSSSYTSSCNRSYSGSESL